MRLRRVESEGDWQAAADLKRGRAYRDVMSVTGWTWEEVAERYESVWGTGANDFHRRMLEKAAEGGELLAWFEGDLMVAYAAVRVSPLCGEDGPPVLSCADLFVQSDQGREQKRQVAQDLANCAERANAISGEVLADPEFVDTLMGVGFRLSKATLRSSPHKGS